MQFSSYCKLELNNSILMCSCSFPFLQPPNRFSQMATSTATVSQLLPIRSSSATRFSSTTDQHRYQAMVTPHTTRSTRTRVSTRTSCTSSIWPRWATAWVRVATVRYAATTATPPTPWPSSACTETSSRKKESCVLARMLTKGLAARTGSGCVWTVTRAIVMPWQSTRLLKIWMWVTWRWKWGRRTRVAARAHWMTMDSRRTSEKCRLSSSSFKFSLPALDHLLTEEMMLGELAAFHHHVL